MTKNKIKPTISQVIYCLKAECERYPEVCEECQLYGKVGCDHCYDDVTDMAIKSLKELEKYRTIGTIKEFKALKEKAEPKKPISIDGWGEYWKCPTCGKYAVDNLGCKLKFCRECGTKFDWS